MQLLRKILFPISFIYALVVYIRNWLFDIQVLKSKSYKTPIVCVGNLSAGGTGKTPMVETIISLFKENSRVAVLSRGYGRKSKGYILATKESGVEELGDEPYQIWSKFPEIALVVDANRQNGIENLEEKENPNIIILDDGFQHRKVKAGFSILLTAYDNLYSEDWYLPTGNLRDSKKEAKRANIIVVTKCPKDLPLDSQKSIIEKLRIKSNQKVLFTYIGYKDVLNEKSVSVSLDSLRNKDITLVTGIANAAPLVAYLEEKGISFSHLNYKDHHFFSESEIKLMQSKPYILTTEKDYVRLKGKMKNLMYIRVEHCFFNDGGKIFEQDIKSYVADN
ncbi:tetraacyldisaccharide 4'-kinase [uncultured Maribacter sp.]|uniref:tetraacyldisaccharide 4'-kinase n=1 Tax=uncultured Maribacter sp. TaxID=431308 RepID=UPI00261724FA|nr:tetraacyldisaccharide 4'-kinase [uncultured Maribacter sp.]